MSDRADDRDEPFGVEIERLCDDGQDAGHEHRREHAHDDEHDQQHAQHTCQSAADPLPGEEALHGTGEVEVQTAGAPGEADEGDEATGRGEVPGAFDGRVGEARERRERPVDEVDRFLSELWVVDEQEDAGDDQDDGGDEREERGVGEPADDEPAAGAAVDDLDADAAPEQRVAHEDGQQHPLEAALLRAARPGQAAEPVQSVPVALGRLWVGHAIDCGRGRSFRRSPGSSSSRETCHVLGAVAVVQRHQQGDEQAGRRTWS